MKVKNFLGHRQALILQEFQTLAEIMSMAFGDGSSKQEKKAPVPQNSEELTRMFGAVFGV